MFRCCRCWHLTIRWAWARWIVGIVIGIQFAAALLSRGLGRRSSRRGAAPNALVMMGLPVAALSGVAYLSSLALIGRPTSSLGLLILGRVLLGCGESLVITGALSWGIGLVGPRNAGKVMAWVGMALFGAYAAGAPLGTLIYGRYDFVGIAVATIVIPLTALGFLARAPSVPVIAAHRVPFYKILGTVFMPGVGVGLCCVGFGVITTFIALLFAARSWGSASLAFTSFGVAFILARVMFAHLLDQIGGAKVALASVLVETAGLLLIWQADSAVIALCRRGVHRLRLLAELSRLWRRSGAARAAAGARHRDGRLRGVRRYVARPDRTGGGRDRQRGRRQHRLPGRRRRRIALGIGCHLSPGEQAGRLASNIRANASGACREGKLPRCGHPDMPPISTCGPSSSKIKRNIKCIDECAFSGNAGHRPRFAQIWP